jgi:hypothetical protein
MVRFLRDVSGMFRKGVRSGQVKDLPTSMGVILRSLDYSRGERWTSGWSSVAREAIRRRVLVHLAVGDSAA